MRFCARTHIAYLLTGGLLSFKNGDMSIDNKPRSGCPPTARIDENVEKIRELVLTNRRQTIDQLSEISGLFWSSVQRILTEDLGMKRVIAKFVPRTLTVNKKRRVDIRRALKQQLETDPDFLILRGFKLLRVMNHGRVCLSRTVNQTFYLEVLRRLRNSVRQKRYDFPHPIFVRQFLTKNGMVAHGSSVETNVLGDKVV